MCGEYWRNYKNDLQKDMSEIAESIKKISFLLNVITAGKGESLASNWICRSNTTFIVLE